ncbi:UNVERIFIED_CONTAM: Signal peptidase complex catalytic subunit SEC11A [Sesamum latifolium]|uniref:Signal peptidase complex catalytic subunit SEC11A n=1 Tax=Sesamum latifolium TaxID=2727402 RepID=A0AAW2UEJ4_9LAMI
MAGQWEFVGAVNTALFVIRFPAFFLSPNFQFARFSVLEWREAEEMGWIEESVASIKSFKIRQALHQAVSLGMIVASALMIWKTLMCVTGSESPVVVVLSESMEPGFSRVSL